MEASKIVMINNLTSIFFELRKCKKFSSAKSDKRKRYIRNKVHFINDGITNYMKATRSYDHSGQNICGYIRQP